MTEQEIVQATIDKMNKDAEASIMGQAASIISSIVAAQKQISNIQYTIKNYQKQLKELTYTPITADQIVQ